MDTNVWISGATGGLGLGIARHVPYPDARIINISRRKHPDYETVIADLADPADWDKVRAHFKHELANFSGKRALFIHNAYYSDAIGLISKVDEETYDRAVLANSAAPQILAESFLRASMDLDCEVGVVLMSSGATMRPVVGCAAYTAAKAGVEHFAEVVRNEIELRGSKNHWIVAFRPGGIDSPGARRNADLDMDRWPYVETRREMHKSFVDIDTAGRRFWAALPPPPGVSVLSIGSEPPPGQGGGFGVVHYVA